jgi:diazepam-binding inhibitor (GABA receptor modulator, acyl-CoA-binding protein)
MSEQSLEEQFAKATKDIKKIPTLEQEELLLVYGYYKQALFGDCNIEKPSFFNFKETAKYDAWMERKGTNKEKAMKHYIKIVTTLLRDYKVKV